MYICCQKYLIEDDGFCNEGVIVNSTGRLKELEEYFSTRQDNNTSPIHLIGLYTFVECLPDGDPVYKHNNSDVYLFKIPAFEKDIRKKVWSVSNNISVDHFIISNEKIGLNIEHDYTNPYFYNRYQEKRIPWKK